MKLGEALTQRARSAQKLNDLSIRIKANVLVQEGTKPQEDPAVLLASYSVVSQAHSRMVERIAQTNANTATSSGGTLLELLQIREHLQRKRNIYRTAAEGATPSHDAYRYMRSELKYEPTVNVANLRNDIDDLEVEIRELDATIQRINWETDLI